MARDLDDPATLTAGLIAAEDERRAAPAAHDIPDVPLPGVGGGQVPLRRILASGGFATATVLFLLNAVDEFDRVALQVLGPDIQRTFGMSDTMLSVINGVGGVLIFAAAIPFGVLADRTLRTRLLGITTLLWSLFAVLAGVVQSTWQLAATRIVNGLGKGNAPVQESMLADAYPIEGRGRIFALHGLANPVGNALGPIMAGGLAAAAGGVEGWRWALVVLAAPAFLLTVVAFRLREPVRGRFEQDAVFGGDATPGLQPADEPRISLSAGFERLKKIRSFFYVMAGLGALGFAVAGAPTIFNLFLEDRFGLDAWERGLVGSVIAVGGAAGAVIGGRSADRTFRDSPPRVVVLIGASLALFGVVFPVSLYMPNVALLTAVLVVAYAFVTAPLVSINSIVAAVVPFPLRGLGFAVVGIYLFLVGGLLGGFIAGALSDAHGSRTALVIIVPLSCFVGGGLVLYAARFVRGDMALVVAELREDRDERQRVALGGDDDVPLLQVRDLDFSYGPVQVLFDVALEVRRGEVLALLGTNGAGKSTLLRAVSGLDMPDRGVVRFAGRTITYASAEDRVRMGIVQVPSGRAVFPSLSVRENLVAGAYSFVWDTDRVNAGIDRVVELFPRLGERLEQPAGTLSGGEQQMLAIGKALLLEPELLLIDELSLGLAPVVVQAILAVVERLNADGVTIVIVEQSVNIALSVADRAVFMEKGQVRFTGRAADLLKRDDLVRAVFLGSEGG